MRDFYPHFAITGGKTIAGVFLMDNNGAGILELLALLSAASMLSWKFYEATRYWKLSVIGESVAGQD